jgi:NADPH:quinone reductase-like Zn-dependent oxidoreductase
VKAIRFHQHGGSEVLRYEDVPDPTPGPGEALVRVRACALNHLDLWQRRGIERVPIPLPHISGADASGDVVSSPPGIPAGRRVMIQPGLSCGRCDMCLSGRDNECAQYDILGYRSDGAYAEYVKVPVQNLIPIPDHVGYVDAAAFPLTFLTAWHMLVTRAQVRAGEDVLVLAAGSGVGQAAIQIARLQGARVFATAGSEEKMARARELGVLEVINHSTGDFAAEIRRLTGKRGVDVVVEHVGDVTWERSLRALARGGRLVTCGATSGHEGSIDLRVLFAKQISLLGSYMGSKGELWRVAGFFFAGQVQPTIDRIYPLAEAAEAQSRLEARGQFGKVVLEC